jgi:hypothetical protein
VTISKLPFFILTGLVALGMFTLSAATYAQGKQTIGWVERVGITDDGFQLHAKIDTGADNSAINAPDLEFFERDGVRWVRFSLLNREGRNITLARPLVKKVRIKRNGNGGERRWVVKLGLCIGNVYKVVNVNLGGRDRHKYQMLVGRSFLAGSFLVDSSLKYTKDPGCKGHEVNG